MSFITNQTVKKTVAQSRYAAAFKIKNDIKLYKRILPEEFTLNIKVLT